MIKIKSEKLLIIGYWLIIAGLLIYTRLINLNWGLPYPFHPDERNMAVAIQNLSCPLLNFKFQIINLKECFNPHFFAYGQFSLYLGYLGVLAIKFFDGNLGTAINFQEAVFSLRLISVAASILNFLIIVKIIEAIQGYKKFQLLSSFIISFLIIFSPFFIQFAHFGTTESLLMLFYSLMVYFSLKLIILKAYFNHKKFLQLLFLLALIGGIATATKISSLIFIFIPLFAIFYSGTIFARSASRWYRNIIFKISNLGIFIVFFLFFSLIFSPHHLLSFDEFISAVRYERDVALGKYLVFYTRQFVSTIPVWFQLTKIFPYALGLPVTTLAALGFLGLSWRDKKINLLRMAFLVYFLPNSFLFVKWTRFMAPVFPLMVVFAILFLLKIKIIDVIKIMIVIISIVPGLAYLSVYQNPDVRFTASEWIYKNIPENAYILSETANVVDLPVLPKGYQVNKAFKIISFNFYDLDTEPKLQEELKYHLKNADYIIIPSRRILANHYCQKNFQFSIFNFQSINRCLILKQKYLLLNQYYSDLFSGKLGFEKVAEFNSFPRLNFQFSIFNFQLKFADEQAEETWSVFDHPVIRIYKKSQNPNLKFQNQI